MTHSSKHDYLNYHPLDHMTMSSNSRACLCPNRPRLTHSIPLNIKPAKNLLKNTSRQGKSPLQNLPRPCHSSLSKRRKLESYIPAKIISTSVAIPSRMPTPFSLSPSSLTNYKDCRSSPNSMYDGGTIMSHQTRGLMEGCLHHPTRAI